MADNIAVLQYRKAQQEKEERVKLLGKPVGYFLKNDSKYLVHKNESGELFYEITKGRQTVIPANSVLESLPAPVFENPSIRYARFYKLTLLFGYLGINYYPVKVYWKTILYIMLFIVSYGVVSIILWIIDIIRYRKMSEEDYNLKFGKWVQQY